MLVARVLDIRRDKLLPQGISRIANFAQLKSIYNVIQYIVLIQLGKPYCINKLYI
jgi:hypothetical protein